LKSLIGVKNVAKRSSEKAWIDKNIPKFSIYCRKFRKVTFLEFTRYYRWYCVDGRSEILRRINQLRPNEYFNNTRYYPRWPRLVR
jgi:hypothetical protein